MEQKTKAAILHDIIRKFASGGKDITPHDWRAFVEAQNDGYQTGPEIGGRFLTSPCPTNMAGAEHWPSSWEQMGCCWSSAAAPIGDPTAATSSSSCSSLLENSRRTGLMPHRLPMTRAKFSKPSARLTTSSIHSCRMSVAKLSADSGY